MTTAIGFNLSQEIHALRDRRRTCDVACSLSSASLCQRRERRLPDSIVADLLFFACCHSLGSPFASQPPRSSTRVRHLRLLWRSTIARVGGALSVRFRLASISILFGQMGTILVAASSPPHWHSNGGSIVDVFRSDLHLLLSRRATRATASSAHEWVCWWCVPIPAPCERRASDCVGAARRRMAARASRPGFYFLSAMLKETL